MRSFLNSRDMTIRIIEIVNMCDTMIRMIWRRDSASARGHGVAWHNVAWRSMARRGVARHDGGEAERSGPAKQANKA